VPPAPWVLLSNLTAGEILEQLWHANQIEPIRNVVFMGMGEPLDNYDAVVEAIHGMVDVQRFSLAMAHVCISTVGVVNRLRTLARDAPGVSLALSLHAPNQTLRQQIVPTSKAWPLDKIMAAVDAYLADMAYLHPRAKPPRTMIEYVLIDGVNDSLDNADELGRLLKDRPFHVNVIPYNPTDVPHDYRRPPRHVSDAVLREGARVWPHDDSAPDNGRRRRRRLRPARARRQEAREGRRRLPPPLHRRRAARRHRRRRRRRATPTM
jgi:adenine C2-methylase RlmN of 23S rRNA A2503 and tRNA A37